MKSSQKYAAGSQHITLAGLSYQVVAFNSPTSVDIQFDATGYKATATAQQLKIGLIKDRLHPVTFGVGYLGLGDWRTVKEHKPLYVKWTTMLRLCYGDKDNMFYIGDKVHVCEEWHNYQTFCDWLNANGGTTKETRLKRAKGATVFSPGTCKIITK